MRLVQIIILCLFFLPFSALAEGGVSSLYQIDDVSVDVSAKNAVEARDTAIKNAQRQALQQLLERLDAKDAPINKLSDDDIATLVRNFEVSDEKRSSVRYIGNFTVQFKPNSVHKYLQSEGISYSEKTTSPVVVLPISMGAEHPVLWEETTKWHAAWDAVAQESGLVPVVIPAGDLGDIGLISTADAMAGKAEALQSIAGKYDVAGVVTAQLSNTSTDPQKADYSVDVKIFDRSGDKVFTDSEKIPTTTAASSPDTLLQTAARTVRKLLDKNGLNIASTPAAPTTPQAGAPVPDQPGNVITATIAINSLPEWATIKRRLDSIPAITHTTMINLTHGNSTISIDYSGSLQKLQEALSANNLSLGQSGPKGDWVMIENGTRIQ